MSYIFPNTTVLLLHECPLDSTQEHTIFFSTPEAQYEYFATLAKVTLPANSYQRVNKGEFKAAVLADDIYDCNYMMFQNASFGDRVFYAFVESVEYVSNTCTLIRYKLDVMQTWLFDYQTQECFVERETPETDGLFEHLLTESLDCGDETVRDNRVNVNMGDLCICLVTSKLPEDMLTGEKPYGLVAEQTVLNGVYTGLNYIYGYDTLGGQYFVTVLTGGKFYSLSDDNPYNKLQTLMDWYLENGEDYVVSMYEYPKRMPETGWLYGLSDDAGPNPINILLPYDVTTGFFDGYVPKCKKLYTYPYIFILAYNNLGQTAEYRFEDFYVKDENGVKVHTDPAFKLIGTFVGQPNMMVYPEDYKGIAENFMEGLSYGMFPQCAWSGDAWQAYWAQNKNSIVFGAVADVVGTLATAASFTATGHPLAAASYGVGGVIDAVTGPLTKMQDLKNTPPQIHGQLNGDYMNAYANKCSFEFSVAHIKREYAMAIDDYFYRYGYACHRCKHPNHAVRPHWTFTKTRGCTIVGSVPAEDAREICNIYDKGITWWRHGEEVGHYELDNSPSTE